MISKKERFERWRKEKAKEEYRYFESALFFENFLADIESLSHIPDALNTLNEQTLPPFIVQKKSYYRFSVLLHTILSINEAIDSLSVSKERALLIKLSEHLSAIYERYADNPADRVKGLLEQSELFLKLERLSFSDKSKGKKLYFAFYLLLLTVEPSLNKPPTHTVWLATWYSIDIKWVHSQVQRLINLLNNVEEQIMVDEIKQVNDETTSKESLQIADERILETPHDSPMVEFKSFRFVDKTTTLSASQKAIQDFFDARYLTVLEADSSPEERVRALLSVSSTINEQIGRLIGVREEETALLDKINKIGTILEAFIQNDAFVWGRKYFLQLKAELETSDPEGFRLLIELAPEAQRTQLLANIEQQQQEQNSLRTQSLAFLSTISSPLIIFSRFLPKSAQASIASLAPKTLDSKAKELIKEIASSVLYTLQEQLALVRAQKEELTTQLSSNDATLKALIEVEASESLAEIALLNTVRETEEQLLPALVSDSEAQEPVSVKTPIQKALQEQYKLLMQGSKSEKEKMNEVILAMRGVAQGINALHTVKIKYDAVLKKARTIRSLVELFNAHTTNTVIAPTANDSMKRLIDELSALNKEMQDMANKLAKGNTALSNYLLQASAEELAELVSLNSVEEDIDSSLLAVVVEESEAVVDSDGEKTVQNYFVECYVPVLIKDSESEETRLDAFVELLDDVDAKMEGLMEARRKHQQLILNVQEIQKMREVLESKHANQLLISMIKERMIFLEEQVTLLHRTIETRASELAKENKPFQQFLIEGSLDDVAKISSVNKEAKACITEYKRLQEKISLLNQLKHGDSALNNYVAEHYTWWVRFTDFLAQFCSFFKTQTSKMIDQAKELKRELKGFRTQCEQEIAAHIATIQKNEPLGDELLGDLPEQHAYTIDKDTVANPENQKEATAALAKVTLFNSNVKIVKEEKKSVRDPHDFPDDEENDADANYTC